MQHVHIRLAVPADAARLETLITAAYDPLRTSIPDLPNVAEGIEDEIANHLVWIAKTDLIVGCLIAHCSNTTLHVINLAVHPAASGQGIGKKLMHFAEKFAHTEKMSELLLAIHLRLPQNVRFYNALGWHVTRETATKIMMKKQL